MTQEIKIEKKASDVIQPTSEKEARLAIREKKDLSGANLVGMQLNELNATGAILRKTDLTKADLSHGWLVNANFYRAALHNTAIHNTVFLGGDLVKTSFKEADLSESALVGVDAELASFEEANLRGAALVGANLTDADFTRANLKSARLATLNVTGADFTEAVLDGAHAYKVDWSKAKVPPSPLPEPFVSLPSWAWSLLIGGVVGSIALFIYMLIRKNKAKS